MDETKAAELRKGFQSRIARLHELKKNGETSTPQYKAAEDDFKAYRERAEAEWGKELNFALNFMVEQIWKVLKLDDELKIELGIFSDTKALEPLVTFQAEAQQLLSGVVEMESITALREKIIALGHRHEIRSYIFKVTFPDDEPLHVQKAKFIAWLERLSDSIKKYNVPPLVVHAWKEEVKEDLSVPETQEFESVKRLTKLFQQRLLKDFVVGMKEGLTETELNKQGIVIVERAPATGSTPEAIVRGTESAINELKDRFHYVAPMDKIMKTQQ